ncbi:MAG: hypothetical protein QOG41_1647 [Thermoleophilaceae bacterium]|nr:hypothetical protein [Thermoleophilaceae bacterium]MEA2388874.1 hypothetical protein [Thermoleophilaceae bacterium]
MVAAGAVVLATAGTALASDFLPKHANYRGKTNHGGELYFKVRGHKVTLIGRQLPLPAGQTCQYASTRRIPLRLYQSDPIGNGPFKIRATQRVNPGTKDWRRLELRMSGQFDPQAEHATGALRAKLFDRHGKCATRDLEWHIHRV